jgi:hypothetical protein
MEFIDYFGYFGSIVVVLSFGITDIKKLRIVNIVGCLIFIVYGIICNVTPVVVTNTAVILMHLYKIYKKQ